jgi:hypothetical protein
MRTRPRAESRFMIALVCLLAISQIPLASAASPVRQDPLGSLAGAVKDASGAVVPGAAISIESKELPSKRTATANSLGQFRVEALPPGDYRVSASAPGFSDAATELKVSVGSAPTVLLVLRPAGTKETVEVKGRASLTSQLTETTSSVEKTVISEKDLVALPLAARSFANIAYLAPMTEPVEPSDPTKARITAVSFAGSSGLNVDLSVDGGDNNDDWIGGFLQNYSPEAMREFTVRTSQFNADTSRTNGGSVIIGTKRGFDQWHGDLGAYFRERALNARNDLDNPAPNPKRPFSRENGVASFGGPIQKGRFWFFSSLEYVNEDANIAYSANSLTEFQALSQLAAGGAIPGIGRIDVPTSVPVPFRDTLFSLRFDWAQSPKSQWFFRGAFDLNHTRNDLVQQATLASTGAFTRSNYFSALINNEFQFNQNWLGTFVFQASAFHHKKLPNSALGLSLAFPFSSTFHTTSGFETFGDNQFVTPITAFPIERNQQKYQFRYDVAHWGGRHSPKFGVNFIHEPVLGGAFPGTNETLLQFTHDPSFYLSNSSLFTGAVSKCLTLGQTSDEINCHSTAAGDAGFAQSVRRLGVYAQDSWQVLPTLTVNYGLRYDTTFGLFIAEGRDQSQNPAVATSTARGLGLSPGIPHDYRKAFAPRLGLAYSPGSSNRTVIRAGVGLYYNDLAQNGWAQAFQSVNQPFSGALLGSMDQGFIIDPHYRSPYALQASFGVEHAFAKTWHLNVHYEHQQGVHQYRRYEYISSFTLPQTAPSVSVFRTDNRSRYDGVSFAIQHSFSKRFDLSAHYTLAKATTWGATVGELFDYVNGVSDVRNAFGPGDHGPSGEDVRHRFVIAARLVLPYKVELATISQFESARPFTISTPMDINGDGLSTNDRAVVNGVQTQLDQFRGTPYQQIDLRVSREFKIGERMVLRPFVEFFNLLNRTNPGNNYVGNVAALPFVPPGELANIMHICLNADCSSVRPTRGPNDLRLAAGALGDFFGPGTTVGIPFAAQLGVRFSF